MSRRHPENPRPQRPPSGPWKSGPLPVIGVIGGIGAGKSAATTCFGDLGAFVLDADAIGHTLLDQTPCRDLVLERFGEAVLGPYTSEGERRPIDRRALAAIVFASPPALRELEAILHPAMRKTFDRAITRQARLGRVPAVVLDAAILYETGWDTLCDVVVYVDAPDEVRLARLEASRGWTAETLATREKAQGPAEEKRRQADHILPNDGSPKQLASAAKELWPRLIRPRGRRPDRTDAAPSARGQPSTEG